MTQELGLNHEVLDEINSDFSKEVLAQIGDGYKTSVRNEGRTIVYSNDTIEYIVGFNTNDDIVKLLKVERNGRSIVIGTMNRDRRNYLWFDVVGTFDDGIMIVDDESFDALGTFIGNIVPNDTGIHIEPLVGGSINIDFEKELSELPGGYELAEASEFVNSTRFMYLEDGSENIQSELHDVGTCSSVETKNTSTDWKELIFSVIWIKGKPFPVYRWGDKLIVSFGNPIEAFKLGITGAILQPGLKGEIEVGGEMFACFTGTRIPYRRNGEIEYGRYGSIMQTGLPSSNSVSVPNTSVALDYVIKQLRFV